MIQKMEKELQRLEESSKGQEMQELWLEELCCVLKYEARLREDGMEKVWEVCVCA